MFIQRKIQVIVIHDFVNGLNYDSLFLFNHYIYRNIKTYCKHFYNKKKHRKENEREVVNDVCYRDTFKLFSKNPDQSQEI